METPIATKPAGIGYMFTQWNTRPDGKGDAYKPGEEKEINTDIIFICTVGKTSG